MHRILHLSSLDIRVCRSGLEAYTPVIVTQSCILSIIALRVVGTGARRNDPSYTASQPTGALRVLIR